MNCAFFRMNVNQILLFGSKEHHHVKRSNGMKCQNNIFVLTATSPITRTFNSSFIFLGCCRRTNYFALRHLIVLKRKNIDLSNRLQQIYAVYWVLLLRWPLLRFLKCDRIFLLMSLLKATVSCIASIFSCQCCVIEFKMLFLVVWSSSST